MSCWRQDIIFVNDDHYKKIKAFRIFAAPTI